MIPSPFTIYTMIVYVPISVGLYQLCERWVPNIARHGRSVSSLLMDENYFHRQDFLHSGDSRLDLWQVFIGPRCPLGPKHPQVYLSLFVQMIISLLISHCIFHLSLDSSLDFDAAHAKVLATVLEVFAGPADKVDISRGSIAFHILLNQGIFSPSVQHSQHLTQRLVLERIPQVGFLFTRPLLPLANIVF